MGRESYLLCMNCISIVIDSRGYVEDEVCCPECGYTLAAVDVHRITKEGVK